MADTIPTRIVVNGQEMTIDAAPRFTCIVHQQGFRVNIPEFVEINGRNTIECMEKMSQRAWEHISTGQLFQILFREIFPEKDCSVPIPLTIAELNAGDFGVVHAAGMITLGCEAIFEGKTKLFFRTPEDHLHPKAERRIIGMFRKMQELLAPDEEAGVATAEAPDEPEDEPAIEPEQPVEPVVAEEPTPKKPRKKKDT
jgi:hypothetical protein